MKLQITLLCGGKTEMQMLDCRNLKDLLDSYLSDELSVETNHAVLQHVEHCPACRAEMSGRRGVRESLRRAGTQLQLSEERLAQLRQRLRADLQTREATPSAATVSDWPERDSLFNRWFGFLSDWKAAPLPVAAMVVLALTLGAGLFFFRPIVVTATELSQELMREAMGDHDYCSAHFRHEEKPLVQQEIMTQYDPAYASLDRVAEIGAQGLRLRAAHLCEFAGRKFAHLVYTRGTDLVSLLVTERNEKAMKNGKAPNDDGLKAGLQQEISGNFKVSAYQTKRHVVLVVSPFSQKENQALAESIALPVSHHLRNLETPLQKSAVTK